MSCLFCRIVAGDIPASKVYEDEQLLAFNDINPQAPMHVLVIPKAHVATTNELAPEHDGLVGSMVRRAAEIARERGYDGSVQHERPGGSDGVPSAPARDRRQVNGVATRLRACNKTGNT